jgi:hypothetical protein
MLSIKLADFTIYLRSISIIGYIYSEGLLSPNSLEYVGSAATTSRVYASSTAIELIAENNNLLHYAPLEWHDVLT